MKSILVALIHHNLVTWTVDGSTIVYSFDVRAAVALVRVPRYLQVIRDIFSENSETIVEEIINCGKATLSQTLFRVGCRIHADDPSKLSLQELKKEFYLLRDAGFIEQSPLSADTVEQMTEGNEFTSRHKQAFSDSEINLSDLHQRITASEKDEGEQPDRKSFWKVNVERFDVQLRFVCKFFKC